MVNLAFSDILDVIQFGNLLKLGIFFRAGIMFMYQILRLLLELNAQIHSWVFYVV